MPKAKCSDSSRLIGFFQEFGEKYFSTCGKILFCKVCEISVMAAKRFCVRQHCETNKKKKHQKNLHLQSIKQNRQKLLLENHQGSTLSEYQKLRVKIISNLSDDRSKASSKTIPPLNAI
jgi:hypothetical protein